MRPSILIGPGALILIWILVSSFGTISPIILPSFGDVFKAFVRLTITDGDLLYDVALTGYRTLLSFLVSCLLGIPIGLSMGYAPRVYRSLEVLVDFFRSIPPIALFPLLLLTLGIGELSKLGVPFYGCFLVVIINSVYGVLNAPSLRRLVGKVYGFSKTQLFWKIVFPDALPQVFVGMRTALSLALVLTVVVEMFIGSNDGLGKKIYDYHLLFESDNMYATIIVIGLFGYALNKLFRFFEKSIVHWADQ